MGLLSNREWITRLHRDSGPMGQIAQFLLTVHDDDGLLQPDAAIGIGGGAIEPSQLSNPDDNTLVLLGDATWGAPPIPPPVTVTPVTSVNIVSGTYTVQFSDGNGCIAVDSSSATVVSIPDDTALPLPVGTFIEVFQLGTGQVTVGGTGSDSVVALGGTLALTGQYARAVVRKLDDNFWVLAGEIGSGGTVTPPGGGSGRAGLPILFTTKTN